LGSTQGTQAYNRAGGSDARTAALDAEFFAHTPVLAICMPTGALTSLAGNLDPHHDVVA
jgi:hypothetical protein